MHCFTTLLVYAVICKLLASPLAATLGAAIYAVHPIHTEAVDWIAVSTDLGCALFLLLSFYFYLRKRSLWVASLLSFLAALLWKEMAAPLPLLIAAHQMLMARNTLKKAALATLPYWAVFAVYLALRRYALGVFYASQATWALSPVAFMTTLVQLLADYWWKLLWPTDLNVYHLFDSAAPLQPIFLLQLGFLCVIVGFVIFAYRRYPPASFACLWVFLSLLPVLNVYHLGSNIFGERYLYTPSIGFCLLIAWVAAQVPRLPAVAAIAIVSALSIMQDRHRAQDWADDFSLFSTTVQDSPRAAVVNNIYAGLLRTEKNDLPGAEQHYRDAITLAKEATPPQPSQVSIAYVGLAQVYDEQHDPQKALEALDEAQRINPLSTGAPLARAVILAETGNWQTAKPILEHLLKNDPNNDVALNTMGMITWQGEHNNTLALEYFRRALNVGGLNVTAASIHNNLGAIYGDQNQYSQAMTEFQTATELDAQNPEYPTNLGSIFGMTGRKAEAEACFQRALQIQPGYQPALAGLDHLQKMK